MELNQIIAQRLVKQRMRESVYKPYALMQYEGAGPETGIEGDKFYILDVVKAGDEGEANRYFRNMRGRFPDSYVTEISEETYEEFMNQEEEPPFQDEPVSDEFYTDQHADYDEEGAWEYRTRVQNESRHTPPPKKVEPPARNYKSTNSEKVKYANYLIDKAKRDGTDSKAAWDLVDFLYDTMLLDTLLGNMKESKNLKEDYKDEYVKVANSTSRSGGASALDKDGNIRSVTARYVMQVADKDDSILDFGAGKGAVQSAALKDKGFTKVTAYDFGSNSKQGLHDPQALSHTYNIVFASNVLNVSSDEEMLRDTLKDIWKAVKTGGKAIFNYPSSPRKAGLSTQEVENIIRDEYNKIPKIVSGTKSAPVWEVTK